MITCWKSLSMRHRCVHWGSFRRDCKPRPPPRTSTPLPLNTLTADPYLTEIITSWRSNPLPASRCPTRLSAGLNSDYAVGPALASSSWMLFSPTTIGLSVMFGGQASPRAGRRARSVDILHGFPVGFGTVETHNPRPRGTRRVSLDAHDGLNYGIPSRSCSLSC